MITTVNTFATIVLAGAALSLAATANSADLEVSIEGLRSAEGQAHVALHQRVPNASFPDEDGAVAKISQAADPNGARGFMGPPSFDDAVLTIGSGKERISVVVPIAYPGS